MFIWVQNLRHALTQFLEVENVKQLKALLALYLLADFITWFLLLLRLGWLMKGEGRKG